MSKQQSQYVTWTWVIALILAFVLLWALMTGKGMHGSCCHSTSKAAVAEESAPDTSATPSVTEAFSFSASAGTFSSKGDASNLPWVNNVDTLHSLLGNDLEANGDDRVIILTGTVNSEAEKQQKASDAQAFFGEATTIDDQISVATNPLDNTPSIAKIYFDSGYHRLPAGGADSLQPVVAYLENNPDTKAIISGFHDATGDLAKNQSLAKKRAQSVYNVLITSISVERIEMRKPVSTDGGGELMEARRVEVSVE